MPNWAKKLLGALVATVVTKAALIFLDGLGIHPDKWVAEMMGFAWENPAAPWMLVGLLGMIGLGFGEPIYDLGRLAWNRRIRPEIDDPVVDYRRLSNVELRAAVLAHANAMRMLDANYMAANDWHRMDMPWNVRAQQDDERRKTDAHHFQTRLRPQAVAMWKELESRLGIFPPFPPHYRVPVALEANMLAGVHPVTVAADFLDELSRRLP